MTSYPPLSPHPRAAIWAPHRVLRRQRISDVSELVDLSWAHRSAAAAVRQAIQTLGMAFATRRYPPIWRTRPYFELRRDLPYVIHAAGRPNAMILVNRQYKPVGSNIPSGLQWARYEDYRNLHMWLSPEQIEQIRDPEYDNAMFGDGSAPWLGRAPAKAYLQRLIRLLDFLS